MSNMGNNPVVSLTPALNKKRYMILIIAAVFNLPTGLGANWALVQPFVKENFGLDSGCKYALLCIHGILCNRKYFRRPAAEQKRREICNNTR